MTRLSLLPLFGFLLLLPPSSALASRNDLRPLLEARTLADLEHEQSRLALLKRTQDECSAELKHRTLPRGCFARLRLENHPDLNEQHRLTRICRETASKSHSRLDLSDDSHTLPADCQAAITDRLEDLSYAEEDIHPEMSVDRTSGPKIE